MAIKIIKFDLPINGTKVTTLDALRDNLTDEIVKLARSGQLERWFKSRQMQQQAQAVAAAISQHAGDTALFLALCAVLEVEVHPDDVSAIFDAPLEAGQHIRDVIEYKRDLEEITSRYNKMLSDLLLIHESFAVEDELDIEDKDAIECAEFLIERINEFFEKSLNLIFNSNCEYIPIDLSLKASVILLSLTLFTKNIGSHLLSMKFDSDS